MLQKFGQAPCRFGIFGSGSMLVEDIDTPDQSTGMGTTSGRLRLLREMVCR